MAKKPSSQPPVEPKTPLPHKPDPALTHLVEKGGGTPDSTKRG